MQIKTLFGAAEMPITLYSIFQD